MSKKDIEYTKSTYFVLPMLGYPLSNFDTGYINCYIKCDLISDYDNHIFVVFERDSLDQKVRLFEEFQDHNNFIQVDEVGIYYVLIFSIPNEHQDDYYRFIAGKYSKFTRDYKTIIKSFWPNYVKGKRSRTISILYPDDEKSLPHRRDLEKKICSEGEKLPKGSEINAVPEIEVETLRLESLYNVVE